MATTLEPDTAPAASEDELGLPGRIVLATFSAGAGVIHLAMAPIHAPASAIEGTGFALVGWFQLVTAAVLLLRPSRRWLQLTLAANLVFIGIWALSRTVGLPLGGEAGGVEPVGGLDGLTVGLQAALVLGAGILLTRPSLARTDGSGALVIASAVPVAVLLLTTSAIASPTASLHEHGDTTVTASGPDPASIEGQLASIDAKRCDKAFNPASYWTEAKEVGVDTVGIPLTDASSSGATASDGHAHGHAGSATGPATTTTTTPDPLEGRGSPLLDKLVSKMGSSSEIQAGMLVAMLAEATPEEYHAFLYQLRASGLAGHAHSSASGDDTGGHGGHIGPNAWVAMTDPAQCAKLQSELQTARDVAMSMPTAKDAQANGYTMVTPYVPGIAAHWMKFPLVDGKFEVDKPEMVLYDGNGLDAHVVGLSYYIIQPGDAEPTQGFTGPNDHFHRHIGLCQRGAMVIGDSTMSEADCAAAGGTKGKNQDGWMNHTWIVPGCESPWGMFSGASPLLDQPLAEQSGKNGGACSASSVRDRYDLSPGGSTPASTTTTTAPGSENAAGR